MTKGNNSKLQNEVLAQIVTDNSAKWLRLGRLFPKIKKRPAYLDTKNNIKVGEK